MIAYFMRCILGSVVTLALSYLILYTLVVYSPGGVPGLVQSLRFACCCTKAPCYPDLIEYLESTYELNKPWPLNYAAWLFNTEDTTDIRRYDLEGNLLPPEPKGVDISIGNLHIKGSGVLTGDLDRSIIIGFWTPVADMYGPGIDVLLAAMMALILISMLVATLQRWRRPATYALPQGPPTYRLADTYQHQIALVGMRPATYSPTRWMSKPAL